MRSLQEHEDENDRRNPLARHGLCRRKRMPFQHAVLVLLLLFLLPSSRGSDASTPIDYLDENSVVLITGIAGFIGSELAMALHRVYGPKKIIGVDAMNDGFGTDHGRTAEELGVFDFKRQRLFHVLQTVGSRCHFYRVDFRPNIPDYQDNTEVHALNQIFDSHPDITHVVHLADQYGLPSLLDEGDEVITLKTQAVPRKKGQIKAGMMEGLLEQLFKAGKMHPEGRVPHLTYASSGHVYSHYNPGDESLNPPPFDEAKPIGAPSSIHGASKVLDEILAKAYHQTRGIYSVGLRFFDVYGPWSSPGTFLFDLAERAVRGGDFVTEQDLRIIDKASRDYIYIDDAVDALMGAMQFRPLPDKPDQVPPPVFINAGTGKTTTVRTILQTIHKFLMSTVTSQTWPTDTVQFRKSVSYASTDRAKALLGFEARVSLEEGIFRLLTWHHDRAFPYGSLDQSPSTSPLEKLGMVACSPFDSECLKGAPVFPCASECSNRHQCTPSFYDSVVEKTRQWTAPCEAVLYTVNLDEDLTAIPSASAAVSTKSKSHVVSKEGHCNLAFVSSSSPLVQQQPDRTADGGTKPLKHGFWTLVLVDVGLDEKNFFLEFLPKVSPGHFFGGDKTKRIIYCDPDVIIDSIPNLLAEAAMQPKYQSPEDEPQGEDDQKEENDDANSITREGATAMLIGKGRPSQNSRKGHTPFQEAIQDVAYRSVRIGVIDQMSGDGFALPLDSSFIVHTLQSEDSRLLRCDVFGEIVQWEVGTDQSAFEFILELHDMWSSVIAKKSGQQPWWVGEGVLTIPERPQPFTGFAATSQKRRLLEALTSKDTASGKSRQAELVKVKIEEEEPRGAEVNDSPAEENAADADGENHATSHKRDANFGDGDDKVTEAEEDAGAEALAAMKKEDKDDDAVEDDDANEAEDGDLPSQQEVESEEKDVSAYDTWMGVLSSTSLQYFVRVVPSSEAGVVVLDDYDV